MALTLIVVSLGLLVAGGLVSLALWSRSRAALLASSLIATLGCAVGLGGALHALLGANTGEIALPWNVPFGGFRIGLDPLSSFFLVCVFLVCGLGAVYGAGHLREAAATRRMAAPGFWYAMLVASMALIVLARDGVLFLLAWEIMSVASFFLVTLEREREEVRRAGLTYLIASHFGLVFLLLFFGLLSLRTGCFDFAHFLEAGAPEKSLANLAFLLALTGFGTKAGFWPLHIWLPDTYRAAPSHIAGVLSGASAKMGIYGLIRAVMLLGPVPPWWGELLIAVGVASGLVGILQSMAQYDLKRLLAYSSVENVGIIAIGLGIGLTGTAHGVGPLAFLGIAGALLHVLNHGLLKGLLFQTAGNVLTQAPSTRGIDSLGGLSRRMPVTALAFLVGAVALSGLPPLNAFAGEWLIYYGAFQAGFSVPGASAFFCIAALAGLGLIGGLAAATFVKAYGVIFLGAPRSAAVDHAAEVKGSARATIVLGALLCLALGVVPRLGLALVRGPASRLAGLADGSVALGPIDALTWTALALAGTVGALALLRGWLLRGREVRQAPTWGCGYAEPTARMQYTGSSFAQPALAPFALVLPRHARLELPKGYFPTSARCEEIPGDFAGERLLVPAARRLVEALGRMRVLQHGRLHLYLVYVFVTLLALLAWQLA